MLSSNILKNIGFHDNKQKVYLAALSLGTATASEIAKRSGVERTTVYKILLELVKEKLAEENIGAIKRFTALNPTALVARQEENKKAVESLLPELLGLYTERRVKPTLKFYEGNEGVKKVFEDPLNNPNTTLSSFSSVENVMRRFGPTYLRHYIERRAKQNITRRSLRPVGDKPASQQNWEVFATDNKVKREIRYLPSHIACTTLIQIYAGKIGVIGTEKENYAFVLESRELYLLLQQTFDWIWSLAEPADLPKSNRKNTI